MTIIGRHRPELQSVRYAVKMYGLVSGPGHSGNAMVWALDDQTIVVVQNASNEPDGVRRSTYPVTSLRVSSLGMTAATDVGEISLVQAPCVCGAGPTATALPTVTEVGKKIDLQPLTEMPGWIQPA